MKRTTDENALMTRYLLGDVSEEEQVRLEEQVFKDIQAFLLSLEPPKYPFAIDAGLAGKGEKLFLRNCA